MTIKWKRLEDFPPWGSGPEEEKEELSPELQEKLRRGVEEQKRITAEMIAWTEKMLRLREIDPRLVPPSFR